MIGYLLVKLAAAIVSVALAAGILARDHGLKTNRLIAAFLFCNGWWALTEFFLFRATDPELATLIIRLSSLGWMPLGLLGMHASFTLSSMGWHPISRSIRPLYGLVGLSVLVSMTTPFVIEGIERGSFGWRPIFGFGIVPAYGVLVAPMLAMLVCWRSVMALPESGGRLQLARIVFFGISGTFVAGTATAIVLPLLGISAMGITTTLNSLVGLAAAGTLRRHGHSLLSPHAFAREILDSLNDAVVLVGDDAVVRDVNRAFLKMVGVRENLVVGQPMTDWIPDFSERVNSAELAMFMEVRSLAGEIVPVVVSSPVAFRDSGRLAGQAFVLRDRREIVSLQRRLIVSARLAAVGDLAKSISRSIEEPVTRSRRELDALLSDWRDVCELMHEAGLDGPCKEAIDEGFELIGECTEGIDRILSIVTEVGGFSSDSARDDFVEVSLAEIVARSLRIASVQAPSWLEVESSLDYDVRIQCHPEEIERVVTNLLVNSIQALEENSPKSGHLVVAVAGFGERALIHVEDDGGGITPEVLDRIFDPFFTTKPVGKGTGLGLAISYHIVKSHGGEIRVSSIRSRGTSVTVELPQAGFGQE